jgi:ribosomal protein S27E
MREFVGETALTDAPPSAPNPDREIPYLRCKDCGTPCYVFEVEVGHITEALCLACGNDVVSAFTVGEWDDDDG